MLAVQKKRTFICELWRESTCIYNAPSNFKDTHYAFPIDQVTYL